MACFRFDLVGGLHQVPEVFGYLLAYPLGGREPIEVLRRLDLFNMLYFRKWGSYGLNRVSYRIEDCGHLGFDVFQKLLAGLVIAKGYT